MSTVAGVDVSPEHFIGGERVASDARFEDRSPIDGALLAEVARGGEREVDLAVRAAAGAFPEWAALGPAGRAPYLHRLADLIDANIERLATVECLDMAMLERSLRARVIGRGARNYRSYADLAAGYEERVWSSNGTANRVIRMPSGPAAVITPWNAPFMLSTWKTAPALAAGSTVILKPAEWSPLSCSLLADLAGEAGLPAGVFNVVQGIGEEAGAALTSDPGVARIAFTGSVDTGRLVAEAAAANLTPVSLELGGKSPFVIFADADPDAALAQAVNQFDNAGQVCLAGTRLLVERSIYDDFIDRFTDAAAAIRQGDPREETTDLGPLITRAHLERVDGFVERAKAAGARLVFGGGVSPELGGLYHRPTLFVDAPPGAEILTKEVFGPVLTAQPFVDEDEAVALANATDFGLAATVYTSDLGRAQRVSERLVAGTVWVNCFFVRDLNAPFGGSKDYGIGREGGVWSFDFYSDVKNTVVAPAPPTSDRPSEGEQEGRT
jgi:5-carboxymethyl-2-hydroxymuconic-semialdehyde dehydrogenase